MLDMKVGTRYIVTKESDDGTFEVGDQVTLLESGDLLCMEGGGWIESSDVEEATQGMEIKIDKEWVKKQKAILMKELAQLEKDIENEHL